MGQLTLEEAAAFYRESDVRVRRLTEEIERVTRERAALCELLEDAVGQQRSARDLLCERAAAQ
jgi:hypothetical protein